MANLVKRIYNNFRGADFRGNEINLVRSPDCLNVWKDYKETESIRTRPDIELIEEFEGTIWGVFFYVVGSKKEMLVHCGTKLYKVYNGTKISVHTALTVYDVPVDMGLLIKSE